MKKADCRIFLFGGCCTGKTYFSKELKDKLNILSYNLDNIFWYGNWEHISKDNLLEQVNQIINENDSWIIDGNYKIIKENIWEKATHIYFCYNNLVVLVWRVFKRCLLSNREGIPIKIKENTNNREPFWELLFSMLRYKFVKKPKDVCYFREIRSKGANIKKMKCNKKSIEKEINSLLKATDI